MADENENLPATEGSGEPAGGLEGGAGSGSQAWTGPSQDEWNSLQENNRKLQESLEGLTSVFAETNTTARAPQPNQGFDLSELDMTDPYQAAWLMDQIVNERLSTVTPYVKNAAQDQGQRQMNELLTQHETALKKEYPDGFDKQLAERAAFAFFDQHGNAEKSVEEAARYAAEVRRSERNAGIEYYKSQNTRGGLFSDPPAGESGVRTPPEFKSFDEVIDKWASQTEV